MTLLQKIRLSGTFGAGVYAVSAVVSLALAVSVLLHPTSILMCLFLKIVSIPVILYLFISLQRKLTIYFYINLGIGKMEFWALPAAVEFAAFFLLSILCAFIGNAIGF